MNRTPLLFYCGINETTWNRHPVRPGPHACISPVYGRTERTYRANSVKVPTTTTVIQDSGAFSDGPGRRKSFSLALDRQMRHGDKYGYASQIQGVASYDLLIDEKWHNGRRDKCRWSQADAEYAVTETVNAARFLSENYDGARVLSAQGVTAEQYVRCAEQVLEVFDPSQDIFGLGGWCISGLMPKVIRPSFNETMTLLFPVLAESGVKRVHIWGVSDITFLAPLLFICDMYGIQLSTDSSAPSVRPTKGAWGFRGWYKESNYERPPVEMRGIHRMILVRLFRVRLDTLRQSEFYKAMEMVK